MEAKLFMHVVKKGDAFLIYFFPYNYYNDIFEKKNVDTLSNHQPYDYMIDLEECSQLELKPIYKFMAFQKYIDKNLKKSSTFQISN